MSLTRRRLFQRLADPGLPSAHAEWIAARGREAGLIEYGEQAMAAGAMPIRIASNENPLGPGQHVLDAIVGKFPEAHRYPFNATQNEGALISALAQKFQAKNENVLLGPGSGEILTHAVRAFTSPTKPLVTAWPSFENPRDTAKKIGTPVKEVGFDGKLRIDIAKMVEASKGAGLVFFCNPNNPTATVHGKTAVADMVKAIRAASPDAMILIDEAYHDYVTDPSYQSAIDVALATPNVFVTRTFSKAYGMAGLRAGYAIGHAPTIKAITGLQDAVRAGHAHPGRRHRRAGQPGAHRRRAQAQHRGEGVHREGVRRHGHHRHRLADQLHVHGHQAARRRLPRRLPRGRRARRTRLPAATRRRYCPHLDRHDGRDAEGRRRVQEGARRRTTTTSSKERR